LFSDSLSETKLQDFLNQHGAKGWKFIKSIHETKKVLGIFSREAHFVIFDDDSPPALPDNGTSDTNLLLQQLIERIDNDSDSSLAQAASTLLSDRTRGMSNTQGPNHALQAFDQVIKAGGGVPHGSCSFSFVPFRVFVRTRSEANSSERAGASAGLAWAAGGGRR
jgi:hypothetical protein